MIEHWIELFIGIAVIISPWMLGFSDVTLARWANVLLGLMLALVNVWAIYGVDEDPVPALAFVGDDGGVTVADRQAAALAPAAGMALEGVTRRAARKRPSSGGKTIRKPAKRSSKNIVAIKNKKVEEPLTNF